MPTPTNRRATARHAILAAGGTALLGTAAIGAGLWWATTDTQPTPADGDTHTHTPPCAAADPAASTVATGDPATTHGVLPDGSWTTCTWTTTDDTDPAAVLDIHYHLHLTDPTTETTGTDAAAQHLAALAPEDVAEPADTTLGTDHVVRDAPTGAGAEVVFRHDNLVIHVAYTGRDRDTRAELPAEDTRIAALDAAETLAADLQ